MYITHIIYNIYIYIYIYIRNVCVQIYMNKKNTKFIKITNISLLFIIRPVEKNSRGGYQF